MKQSILFIGALLGLSAAVWAQPADIRGTVGKAGEKPAVAVADMRGTGAAQAFMEAFNRTLYGELQNSGRLKMVPKTVYPLAVPQQPSDFHQPRPWLTDWSGPPVSANYLAFGYTAVQGNQLVLFGWFYDVSQPTTQAAQVLAKLYFGSLDEAGAVKVARDFAADILKQFGAVSLAETKIYYVSGSTGNKEIWSMDYDGSNAKPFTSYRSITTFPAVSADGTKIAFTTYARGLPSIFVHSLETNRKLPFYNQSASMSAASDFMPDSKHLLIYSTAAGGFAQIFLADVDGSNLRRVSHSNSIDENTI